MEREFDSRALEKEQISQEISSTRIELRKLENELQNALRKLNDANDDVTGKQNRLERLERELEDQRRACRSHDLDREQKTNQVSLHSLLYRYIYFCLVLLLSSLALNIILLSWGSQLSCWQSNGGSQSRT